MNRTATGRFRVVMWGVVCVALSALLTLPFTQSKADVDKDFEWDKKKRTLKVCLESSAGCPAGMADSLKEAISEWNKKLVSWKLVYDTTCTDADVKVKCGKIKGLGQWKSSGGTYGASTENTITINKDKNWGWCNDKHELVDALVHELGHAMRLNDITSPSNSMHKSRSENGHKRSPASGDSTEAGTSDTTGVVEVDEDPPGGKRLSTYTGLITPRETAPLFNLSTALFVEVVTYRPWAVNSLMANPVGENTIVWDATIEADADHSESYWLIITYPDTVLVWDGILKIAPDWWDPTVDPVAVAPNDTVVLEGEEIILDNTASYHPMGYDWMSFRWEIDDTIMVKGQDTTSVILPAGPHTIILRAEDEGGKTSTDTMYVIVDPATDVGDSPQGMNYLNFNYPNPFNPSTTVHFGVAQRGHVTLRIYDVRGALVRTLVDDVRTPGIDHTVTWNGLDNRGNGVASGVYFLRLETTQFAQTRKMVLLR